MCRKVSPAPKRKAGDHAPNEQPVAKQARTVEYIDLDAFEESFSPPDRLPEPYISIFEGYKPRAYAPYQPAPELEVD
ncbi:hypothetical protein RBB50_000724 [Rhinocladiella similis]